MKGNQVRRLQKLERQYIDDHQDFYTGDIGLIYKECPHIVALREELDDYVIRYGPDPPQFYQYGEGESTRRWLWALQCDKKAQLIFQRLQDAVQQEAATRGAEREKQAKAKIIENWEWHLGAPEREAKAAAELEERRRKMEEERLERERKWEEERAARQQGNAGNQQSGGYDPYGWQAR